MSNDPSFDLGAPIESPIMSAEELTQSAAPVSPTTPAAPTRKLVDVYTTMLFVAAIFLLAGSLTLAWEKQRYGDLFGNTWKIPPNIEISAADLDNNFDNERFFMV